MTKSSQQAAIEMAQTMLETRKNDGGPALTTEAIGTAVDQVLGILSPGGVDAAEREAIIRELESRYSVWIGKSTVLDFNDDHEAWLTLERRQNWPVWARYRQYLEQQWPMAAVDALDEATNEILERLEDPNRKGAWDRRGMVVGHVQSGKTSSYTGLICKATDAGYKVIIVLAGIHNNLRSQTQMRLDEGFLGYETSEKKAGEQGQHSIVGVGEIDSNPGIKLDYVTTRHERGDFTLTRVKNFGIHAGGNPMLFVVKKNVSVLKNLLKWIDRNLKGRDVLEDVPLLVIDDEADHASVDTKAQEFDENGKPDEDHDPTMTNRRIRQLLRKFQKSAYVGYTATPFANIYIHEQSETKDEGPDLFPRSFIINLSAPSNYDGPVRIFGLDPNDDDARVEPLPLVRVLDGPGRANDLDWVPQGHKNGHRPLHDGEDAVPPSMLEAMRAFILVCAARRARGQVNAHNSMLIHVTRFTNVQGAVRRQVDVALQDIKKRLKYDANGKGQEAADLRRLWNDDFVPASRKVAQILPERDVNMVPWEEVESQLLEAVDAIRVKTINGKAADILDYEEHDAIGLNVIAIGGDKLARGLTLEGLSVSYFLRASKMYDTLMQMGRWFGYRPGYLDLCRLYMTQELKDWFSHITEASEELRREFDHMAVLGGTPRDYGLRVKSHPEMLVTSRVKMRNGMEIKIDFAGSISETIVFPRDPSVLRENLDATTELIDGMGVPTEIDPIRMRAGKAQKWSGTSFWAGIPANDVIRFLKQYQTHKESWKVNARQLAEFVTRKNEKHELTEWDVALLSGESETHHLFANVKTNLMIRKPRARRESDSTQVQRGVYIIGRLLAPRDEAIDFDENEYAEALKESVRAWAEDPGRSRRQTPPKVASGPAIREVRGRHHPDRGLLLIYPLDPKSPEIEFNGPIIGFGMSFPSSRERVSVRYTVNNVYWTQEYEGDA